LEFQKQQRADSTPNPFPVDEQILVNIKYFSLISSYDDYKIMTQPDPQGYLFDLVDNFKIFTLFEWFLIFGTLVVVAYLITCSENSPTTIRLTLENSWGVFVASLNHGNFTPKKILSLFLFVMFLFFFFQCTINFNSKMSSGKIVRNESCIVNDVNDILRNRLEPAWFNGSSGLHYFLRLKMPDSCMDDLNYSPNSRLIKRVFCRGIEKNILPFDIAKGRKELVAHNNFALISHTRYFRTMGKYICMVGLNKIKLWISKGVIFSAWRGFIFSPLLTKEKMKFFNFL